MRVLVVEDEATLAQQLAAHLRGEGMVVDVAGDGREGLWMGSEYDFDVAVVDVGLPELDGLSLIRRLREDGRAFPVLVLTARDGWQDKVTGLEAGADDYLAKPFHYEELVARIRALVRRAAGFASAAISHGPISLDTNTKEVRVEDQLVELTAFEYNLLEYLMLHPNKVISKTELTEHLYAQDFERDSNVIEVFVGRLRKKLDPSGETKPITTVRGQGYRFAPDP
ncbi:MAG: response regulator transcription factor [Pseudomonadales bacterium]|nr:response regulator transcription factor [Pseudomonadales bacterium]